MNWIRGKLAQVFCKHESTLLTFDDEKHKYSYVCDECDAYLAMSARDNGWSYRIAILIIAIPNIIFLGSMAIFLTSVPYMIVTMVITIVSSSMFFNDLFKMIR